MKTLIQLFIKDTFLLLSKGKRFKKPDSCIDQFAPAISIHSLRMGLILFLFLFLVGTARSAIKTSKNSGSWGTGNNWIPTGVPSAGDDVIIAAGHLITINTNSANLSNLTINGTLTIGNSNANRTVSVTGFILINSGGVLNTAGNGGNILLIGGNLFNNGIFDMKIGGATADVTFNGSVNQTVSGTGSTTDFNTITINNTGVSNNNIVEITSSNFTATAGFLSLTKGIFKVSGNFNLVNIFFNTANPVINADEGLWLNNPNLTVTGQNGDTRLSGLVRISAGTYNVGLSADWWLNYYTGAQLIIEGGALNITGAFFGASVTDKINYTQSGGVVTVNTAGNSYGVASFEIWDPGSSFTMSGGSIVLQKAATAFTDYVNYSANAVITGGKIQAGNNFTPSGTVFWAISTPPLYDLEVKPTNNPLFQLLTNTTVLHDVIISGVLDVASNNVDITVGHDWINNGSFLAGNRTVTFNGTTTQSIGGINPTAFSNINISNTGIGGILLNIPASVGGTATFNTGIISSSSLNLLTFLDNAIGTGANNNGSNPSYVNGPVKKIGNDAFVFPVGKTAAGYHACGISAPALTTDAYTAEYMRASATALGPISAPGLYRVSNCEYWNIDRTAGSSVVDLTLTWNGLSNCNAAAYVNNLASLLIAHFNGTSWNSYGANSFTGNASAGSVTWNSVSTFSPFTLGSNSPANNPLPVKFSSVKAYPVGINNRVEWTNETEEGVIGYEIEKSIDGRDFIRINTVNARRNDGLKEAYTDLDDSVNNKTAWYRIKGIDLAGAVTYSPIVKVSRAMSADVKLVVYPNPVIGNQFAIQLNSPERSNYLIQVINLSGQQLFSSNWQHNGGMASRSVELPAAVAPGIYLVLITGNHASASGKIIVE